MTLSVMQGGTDAITVFLAFCVCWAFIDHSPIRPEREQPLLSPEDQNVVDWLATLSPQPKGKHHRGLQPPDASYRKS